MQNRLVFCLGGIVLLAVALAYWPILHANFVWDDWSFHDMPWLTQGDQWKHYIFKDFNYWTFYFRPLVVALFTVQVRLFDNLPGPMHAVSLALHLIDTVLVGMLAWRCATLAGVDAQRRQWVTVGCLALYGLHPALIETVSWIGCQFDLVTTMLALATLNANARIERAGRRALAVTLLFFLAACAKEAAVAIPVLVLLWDWLLFSGGARTPFFNSLLAMCRRNYLVYGGMLVAGIAYLAFRHWAIGSISPPPDAVQASLVGRVQEICYTYGQYWKIIVWPMSGMNAIHPVNLPVFELVTPHSLMFVALTAALLGWGLFGAIRHKSASAGIVLAATVALAPVLHLLPVHFERSLYHERYATMAIAMVCSMLPLLRLPAFTRLPSLQRVAKPGIALLAFVWFALAIVDIRLIVPMWQDDAHLWRWALEMHPHESQAKDNLLKSYYDEKDYVQFDQLSDRVIADPVPCAGCMLFIAKVAIERRDPGRAAIALENARHSPLIVQDGSMLYTYYLYTGQMLTLQGKWDDAEQLLREAIRVDPKTPKDPKGLEALETLHKLRSAATGTSAQ